MEANSGEVNDIVSSDNITCVAVTRYVHISVKDLTRVDQIRSLFKLVVTKWSNGEPRCKAASLSMVRGILLQS